MREISKGALVPAAILFRLHSKQMRVRLCHYKRKYCLVLRFLSMVKMYKNERERAEKEGKKDSSIDF